MPLEHLRLRGYGGTDKLGLELIDPAAMRPFFAAGNSPAIELIEGAGHFVQNDAGERGAGALAPPGTRLGRLSHDERCA